MSKKKPGLISATLEADYRSRFREIIAKKIKAMDSPTVRKSESISTLDGGTMWLSGSSVTSAKPFTSTTTATGSGWSSSSIYTPFTSSISSFGSASWVFDPDVLLTEDERQMVTEAICEEIRKNEVWGPLAR